MITLAANNRQMFRHDTISDACAVRQLSLSDFADYRPARRRGATQDFLRASVYADAMSAAAFSGFSPPDSAYTPPPVLARGRRFRAAVFRRAVKPRRFIFACPTPNFHSRRLSPVSLFSRVLPPSSYATDLYFFSFRQISYDEVRAVVL